MSGDVAAPEALPRRIFGLDRNVFFLGVVSFLTDLSSEMTLTVLPLFLSNVLGAGTALMVFLGIYFSSLDGFYRLDMGKNGQEIHLDYILPKRTLILRRSEIAEVRRVPSYKGRWQLVLYTPTGARFTSARASYADARKAWQFLNTQLDSPLKPE